MPKEDKPVVDPKEEIFKNYESLKDIANFNKVVKNYEPLIGKVGVSQSIDRLARAKLERDPRKFAKSLEAIFAEFSVHTAWALGEKELAKEKIPEDKRFREYLKKGSELLQNRYNPQEED